MKKIIMISGLFLLLLSLLILPIAAETGEMAVGEETTLGFTETVTGFLSRNGSTLLGVLTLIASFLVAFLYKTGLLPLVRSGLSALGELLGKSRELTERFTEEAGEQLNRMEGSMVPMATALKRSEELLDRMQEKLTKLEEALKSSEGERRKTAEVLRTETELFYELLVSVNLPEAQKDSMTESYYRLKRILEAEE